MKKVFVFDLDQTVICSDHRVLPLLDENRNLDLKRYRNEACKHELIQQDSLLPLAHYMQQLLQDGALVAICTARHMSKSDYVYLRKNGLRAPIIFSRDQLAKHFNAKDAKRIYNLSDSQYKAAYFDLMLSKFGRNAEYTVFDDHQGVLSVAKERGFAAIDAVELNRMLTGQFIQGYEQGEQDGFTEAESIADDVTLLIAGV